jgi:hypothetical protein
MGTLGIGVVKICADNLIRLTPLFKDGANIHIVQIIEPKSFDDRALENLSNMPAAGLANITHLNLSDCTDLTPNAMQYLQKFPGLTSLELGTHFKNGLVSNCLFNEVGINYLKNIPTLHTLKLAGKGSSSNLGELLKEIKGLRVLTLDCPSQASLPSFNEITELKSLTLMHHSKVDDSGLAVLSKITGLQSLTVYRSGITDSGVASICKLEKLESLTLIRCDSLTDDVFGHLAQCQGLKHLDFRFCNAITRRGVSQFERLTEMTVATSLPFEFPNHLIQVFLPELLPLPATLTTAVQA